MTGYCDAHNHLQDERFGGRQEELLADCLERGVSRWVVNGTRETDWPGVAQLADRHPGIVPSFGYHPWYLAERTPEWQQVLIRALDQTPRAAMGEIGLDRWVLERSTTVCRRNPPATASNEPATLEQQAEAFAWQWRLAAERNLPVSVHCLKAWGQLLEMLQTGPRLKRGFLLHSFGGPSEMIEPFVRLGAYFGFPGYFLQDRKAGQREAFRKVPTDRLLVETDAPDQLLPDPLNKYPLTDAINGYPVNHPANLPAVYAGLASALGVPLRELRERVSENFVRLFGVV